MSKWEYRVENFEWLFGPDAPSGYPDDPDEAYAQALNELGGEGWELVSWHESKTGIRAVLKRHVKIG